MRIRRKNMAKNIPGYLNSPLHMGVNRVIADPTVGNATISPVLNNTVPSGSMTLYSQMCLLYRRLFANKL